MHLDKNTPHHLPKIKIKKSNFKQSLLQLIRKKGKKIKD